MPQNITSAPAHPTFLEAAACPALQSFVVISKFTIANGLDDAVHFAF